jgi:stringent starvation protein B
MIPVHLKKDDVCVLNVSMTAAPRQEILDEGISFGAAFGGMQAMCYVPYEALLAIRARENGAMIQIPRGIVDDVSNVKKGEKPVVKEEKKEIVRERSEDGKVVSLFGRKK